MNPKKFSAYAQGKAALRVSDVSAHPYGPHSWRYANGQFPPSTSLSGVFGHPLLLIHFESCPFSRWKDKYWELGNALPEEIARIPFPFYRESISKMQCCKTRSDGECSQSALEDFWS